MYICLILYLEFSEKYLTKTIEHNPTDNGSILDYDTLVKRQKWLKPENTIHIHSHSFITKKYFINDYESRWYPKLEHFILFFTRNEKNGSIYRNRYDKPLTQQYFLVTEQVLKAHKES